mgnify:CR=1 FL=1
MLRSIKASFYFLNNIFSIITESQKLKLIRYNKKLQSDLNISLTNYKFFKGRYIIYESNGKERNIMVILMIEYYMMVNIWMVKEMGKEKNIMKMKI